MKLWAAKGSCVAFRTHNHNLLTIVKKFLDHFQFTIFYKASITIFYFLINQYKMFGRNTAHIYGWPTPHHHHHHQYPSNPQISYVASKPCNIYFFPFGIIIQTFSELLNDNLSICLSNHLFMALLLCTLCQTTENIMVLRYITLCVLFALSLFCDWMKYAYIKLL